MHTTSRAIFCTISHKKGQCKLCREVSILYILHTVNQTLCIRFCCHLDLGLLCNQEVQLFSLLLPRCWFSRPLAAPVFMVGRLHRNECREKCTGLRAAPSQLGQILCGSFACCLQHCISISLILTMVKLSILEAEWWICQDEAVVRSFSKHSRQWLLSEFADFSTVAFQSDPAVSG